MNQTGKEQQTPLQARGGNERRRERYTEQQDGEAANTRPLQRRKQEDSAESIRYKITVIMSVVNGDNEDTTKGSNNGYSGIPVEAEVTGFYYKPACSLMARHNYPVTEDTHQGLQYNG